MACSIEGCEGSPIVARGYCGAHYRRFRRHGDPLGGGTSRGAPRAFIDKALAQETDDCIIWPYGKKEGYGFLNDGSGGTVTASRLICTLAHGEPPAEGMEAAHSCGNRPCCNKRHLRWATCTENNADKIEHGTLLRGEAVPTSRFTDGEVMDMRRRHAGGESQASIGRSYGIGATHVRRIVTGEFWSHLPIVERNAAA